MAIAAASLPLRTPAHIHSASSFVWTYRNAATDTLARRAALLNYRRPCGDELRFELGNPVDEGRDQLLFGSLGNDIEKAQELLEMLGSAVVSLFIQQNMSRKRPPR